MIFGIADTEARVRDGGIDFCWIGMEDYRSGPFKSWTSTRPS